MKTNKMLKIVSRTLVVMVVLLVVTSFLTSGIFAKYLISDSVYEEARVAKWEINFNNGESLHSIVSSTHLESGSTGEWGLDISNKSEVDAQFSDESNIKIRLQSPDFNINHEHNTWDFLVDNEHNHIDNPINFKAVMYNCSLSELDALNGDITNSNIKAVEIFNTKTASHDTLKFQMVIVSGELYFESYVNVGELLNKTNDFYLEMGTGKACLKLYWEVDTILNSANTNAIFKSYHLVKESEYNTTNYNGKLSNTITISSTRYVIAYKEYDYFEYLIYTSSIGGEIMISFNDENGKPYIRRCTKLSNEEISKLVSRQIGNTEKSVNDYIELLEYNEYNKYLEIKSNYNAETGYLSLGLECRIVLDLRVEQVD